MATLPPTGSTLVPESLRPQYFNRGADDSTKNYEALLFIGRRGLQSAELNDLQHGIHARIDGLADSLFDDGNIVSGAGATMLEGDPLGNIQLAEGRIYLGGRIYTVAAAKFTIPEDATVFIGLRKREVVITEVDDPDLLDPAQGVADDFDNYQEPGALRLQTLVSWGWVSGEQSDPGEGEFYEVYTVENGVLIVRNIPPAVQAIIDGLALYDREAHGSYVTEGLLLSYTGENAPSVNFPNGSYVFNLREGRANVLGLKVGRQTGSRLEYDKDFDTLFSNNEQSSNVVDGAGYIKMITNRAPIASVGEIQATRRKIQTGVVRGPANTSDVDALDETSVTDVIRVFQGATEYVEGRDYVIVGDDVDWSPNGVGAIEPVGTYSVEYDYIVSLTSADADVTVDDTFIEVENLAPGTTIRVDYDYKVPRVDTITMDTEGLLHRLRGASRVRNPAPPPAAVDHIALATIYYDWYNDPIVTNVAVKNVPFAEIEKMQEQIFDLYDLVAQERLKQDINRLEPASKRGVFVDPFFDNDLRDPDVVQDAATLDGLMMLPMSVVMAQGDSANNALAWTLPFTKETIIEQPRYTQCMKINPYQAFEPIPASVTLIPDVDRWVIHRVTWNTPIVRRFVNVNRRASGGSTTARMSTVTTTQTRTVASSLTENENATIRPITVQFLIDGFGATEALERVVFDGIEVTPVAPVTANGAGHAEGSFVIPAGIPVGSKMVEFYGAGGTYGEATFVGEVFIQVSVLQQIRTITGRRRRRRRCDPLAQTFTLEEDRMLCGVRVKFCKVGNTDNLVFLQLRETNVGLPNDTVLAEGVFDTSTLNLDGNGFPVVEWSEILFSVPAVCQAGREYAVVLLTDDSEHSVAIATLGQFARSDWNGGQSGWVTRQPYQDGVLLASSNAVTWTPIQESDLTMQLLGCRFTASELVVPLGQFDGDNVSDIIATAGVIRTSVTTDVTFRYHNSDTGETWEETEDQPLRLDGYYFGTWTLEARLRNVNTAETTMSPILFPFPQTILGTMATTGLYQGRAVTTRLPNSIPTDFDVVVVMDVQRPTGATITPKVRNDVSGSPGFTIVPYVSQTELGDGWVEMQWRLENLAHVTTDYLTAVQVSLTGSPGARPLVRNLRFTTLGG